MNKKELLEQRLQERTQGKRWKLPEGETTFRVLPNAKGEKFPEFFEYRMHGQVGPGKKYMRCGKNFRGEGRCWLCDIVIPSLEKSPKQSKKLAAAAMKAKNCCGIMVATIVNGKWRGPFFWEAPFTVANKIMGVMHKHNVADPKRGCNLTISRTGTGKTSTRYGDLDRDENKSAVPPALLQRLTPFSDHVRPYDEAYMKASFYGRDKEDMEEPEPEREERRPMRRARAAEEEQFDSESAEETFEEAEELEGESGDEFIEGEEGDAFDEEAAEAEIEEGLEGDEFGESSDVPFDEAGQVEGEEDLTSEFEEEQFEEPEAEQRRRPATRRPAPPPPQRGKRTAPPARRPASAPVRRPAPAASRKPVVKRRK